MLGISIYLLVCALAGTGYGFFVLFADKPPLYFQIVILSMASMLYSRIFYLVNILFYNGIPNGFNLGFFGFAAFLLFLFFANYGQIDSLVDDRDSLLTRYRLIPLILPAVELIIALLFLTNEFCDISVRVMYILLSMTAGAAGYLNLKHLIIPDIKGGIVDSIRGFNLICILMEILTLAEVGLTCFDKTEWAAGAEAVLGILYILILPLLRREVSRWTQ